MARGTRMAALAAALHAFEDRYEVRGKAGEVYVNDRGPGWKFPQSRFEAGIIVDISRNFGFRSNCVYGSSWADLVEHLEALPAKERYAESAGWRTAAFDALAEGADPAVVHGAVMQLSAWVQYGEVSP